MGSSRLQPGLSSGAQSSPWAREEPQCLPEDQPHLTMTSSGSQSAAGQTPAKAVASGSLLSQRQGDRRLHRARQKREQPSAEGWERASARGCVTAADDGVVRRGSEGAGSPSRQAPHTWPVTTDHHCD